MPRRPLSLRLKVLVVLVSMMLPFLGLSLWGASIHYEQQREKALDGQVRTAETVAALIDTVFEDSIDLGRALANDPILRSMDQSLADPHLQRLAASYPQYLSLGVFNAQGESVGESLAYAPGEPRINVGDFWYFRRAMATGQPVVVIAVPILDRLSAMLEQWLDVSAMEAGRLVLRKRRVSLSELVRQELVAQGASVPGAEESASRGPRPLLLARHRVEAHGGRIWVESQVGEGSTFYFSLPVAAG